MQPEIDATRFGAITIAGKVYKHDILIRLDGSLERRRKKLSKDVYGTSHKLSLAEAEFIYQEGAGRLIYGSGQFGRAKLTTEAAAFFVERGCRVELLPTPQAVQSWNKAEGAVIGLFHISC